MDPINVARLQELYPLLIPNANFSVWNGIVSLEGEDVTVSISTPHFTSLKNISLMCPVGFKDKFHHKLKSFEALASEKHDDLSSLLIYLGKPERNEEKYEAAGKFSQVIPGTLKNLDFELYNQVLNELKLMDSESIVTCTGDLSEVTLRVVDMRGIEHRLVLSLPPEYPVKHPAIKDIDLPDIALTNLNQSETVTDLFNNFQTTVDSLQEFWNTYDNLLKSTWVIDPEHPQRRDTHCRIVIGENVTMLISLNPLDVNTCPDIKFLGPEKSVFSYISSLEKKLKTEGWNEDTSVLDNLLVLLNIDEFPQQDFETVNLPKQDECSICFMMRLEDQTLPTKICNNSKCHSYFHIPCLAQWFQAVPTNETSFNLISGDCPSCGERILCPIKVS